MSKAHRYSEAFLSPTQIIGNISRYASWISYAAITMMMVFVAYDVIARYFGYPTSGSNDVVQVLILISVSFAFSYTQFVKRHPSTSFLVMRLSLKTQMIFSAVTSFMSLIPFILLVWTSLNLAQHLLNTHEGTMTLGIPLYPLVYSIVIGSILMCLVITADFFDSLRKASSKGAK